MLISLFLIGNIGSTEILLLLLLPVVLVLALLWRLFRPAKPAVVVHQNAPSASVADELLKLQQLRDAGTITPAEFERQKARLLA